MIDFQNTRKILYYQWVFSFQSRFSWNICTLARIKQREKEIIISIFIAGSSLIMATPRKIYDTVSKTIILNMFKYFKDESLKFPSNHPQRSYLKKTVTGLNHRTISWIFQSAKTSTASSSATQMPVPTTPALPASSNAAQVEKAPSATRKYTPELYFRWLWQVC